MLLWKVYTFTKSITVHHILLCIVFFCLIILLEMAVLSGDLRMGHHIQSAYGIIYSIITYSECLYFVTRPFPSGSSWSLGVEVCHFCTQQSQSVLPVTADWQKWSAETRRNVLAAHLPTHILIREHRVILWSRNCQKTITDSLRRVSKEIFNNLKGATSALHTRLC